ncbi:hypothetical protein BYT27DRAFT_6646953 [Phlegmacium glaucopus]|nr:hypothetical protein BYT27DRAFT_6646953 [Phlegmacium glaucopus]
MHGRLFTSCLYIDCDESFRSAPPLWKHMRAGHENGKLKPSTQPFYPKLKPLDAIPGVVPSYMITTRKVKPIAISSERHAVVGPWVLRNIAGLERERLTRQKSRKAVRSSNGDIPDEDASNDYDFLTARPTRYSSHLSQPVDMKVEDLNSENISKMVDEGLILWGGEEEPSLPTRTPSPAGSYMEYDSPTLGRQEMLTELIDRKPDVDNI